MHAVCICANSSSYYLHLVNCFHTVPSLDLVCTLFKDYMYHGSFMGHLSQLRFLPLHYCGKQASIAHLILDPIPPPTIFLLLFDQKLVGGGHQQTPYSNVCLFLMLDRPSIC